MDMYTIYIYIYICKWHEVFLFLDSQGQGVSNGLLPQIMGDFLPHWNDTNAGICSWRIHACSWYLPVKDINFH